MLSINLFVPDSEIALAFYEKAFGAVGFKTSFDGARGEKSARFQIGGDRFALADENPALGSKSVLTLGGVPMCVQLFVPDVRETMERVLDAGGKLGEPSSPERPILAMPDGTEFCNVIDPFGFYWSISKENTNSGL